jgi:hypothetical protein
LKGKIKGDSCIITFLHVRGDARKYTQSVFFLNTSSSMVAIYFEGATRIPDYGTRTHKRIVEKYKMYISATKPDTFHHKTLETSRMFTRCRKIRKIQNVVSAADTCSTVANHNQSKICFIFAFLLADSLLHTSVHTPHIPPTLLPTRKTDSF